MIKSITLKPSFFKSFSTKYEENCILDQELLEIVDDIVPFSVHGKKEPILYPILHPVSKDTYLYGISKGVTDKCMVNLLRHLSTYERFDAIYPILLLCEPTHSILLEILDNEHAMTLLNFVATRLVETKPSLRQHSTEKNEVLRVWQTILADFNHEIQSEKDALPPYTTTILRPEEEDEELADAIDQSIVEYIENPNAINKKAAALMLSALPVETHSYMYCNEWTTMIMNGLNDLQHQEMEELPFDVEDVLDQLEEILLTYRQSIYSQFEHFFSSEKTVGYIAWRGHARAFFRQGTKSNHIVVIDSWQQEHNDDQLSDDITLLNDKILNHIGKKISLKHRRNISEQGDEDSCGAISLARICYMADKEKQSRMKEKKKSKLLAENRNYTPYVNRSIDCMYVTFVSLLLQRSCENAITKESYLNILKNVTLGILRLSDKNPKNAYLKTVLSMIDIHN